MNLLMLAALKRVIDERNAAQARARNRRKKAAKRDRGYASPSSGNRQNRYSELQHFYKVVAEDPILVAFFQAIEKKGKDIDVIDTEKIRQEVENGLKAQAERAEKIENIRQEIIGLGLDVSYVPSHRAYEVVVGEKVSESGNRAFGEKGEYARVIKSFRLSYDGLVLDSDWFKPEKREVNPFDVRYAKWYDDNKVLNEKIAAQKEAIAKQEKRIKYGLFKKDEKEEELKRLQEELCGLEKRHAYGEEIKRERAIFEKITPVQKEKLHEYYELVKECSQEGDKVTKRIRAYYATKVPGPGEYRYSYEREGSAKERNKWGRVVETLISEGELSEELLDAVDTVISEENIGYEKYSDGYDYYTMKHNGYSDEFIKLIEWFLETRREKIALKALHRKEAAYKVLEAEHKKLCDAAGLVDRAEEIEGKVLPGEGDEEYGE